MKVKRFHFIYYENNINIFNEQLHLTFITSHPHDMDKCTDVLKNIQTSNWTFVFILHIYIIQAANCINYTKN